MMIIMICLSSLLFLLLVITICICAARGKQIKSMNEPSFQDDSAFMSKSDHPDTSFTNTIDMRPAFSSKVRPMGRLK